MNKISFFNANKTESITFERFGTEVKFEHIEYENDLPVSYFTTILNLMNMVQFLKDLSHHQHSQF